MKDRRDNINDDISGTNNNSNNKAVIVTIKTIVTKDDDNKGFAFYPGIQPDGLQ